MNVFFFKGFVLYFFFFALDSWPHVQSACYLESIYLYLNCRMNASKIKKNIEVSNNQKQKKYKTNFMMLLLNDDTVWHTT